MTGGFGDGTVRVWGVRGRAAQKRGALLHRALVEGPCSCIHRLAGGDRGREVRFGRFLRHASVSPAAIFRHAGERTGALAAGRSVVVFQDMSDLVLGGAKRRRQGFGPVGKGGSARGLKLHAALAVDAVTGEVLGLAGGEVWNRTGGTRVTARSRRAPEEKESQVWNDGAVAASLVLAQAASIVVVSDRESDIYADYSRRPANVDLLIRARHNRCLADGGRLYAMLDAMAPAGEPEPVDIPARPGQAARKAKLEVRFGSAEVKAPSSGMPAWCLQQLPESLAIHAVDVRETGAPPGIKPIHWRLISTRPVPSRAAALALVALYRRRWAIEEYFHTLKTGGFDIEAAETGDPRALMALVAAAAVAAVTVMQLLKARDNPQGQAIAAVFESGDRKLIEAVNAGYEGPHPTQRQKNPHPTTSLAYATWVIGRLGGWTGYYDKPGPKTLNRGLQAFHNIKQGAEIHAKDM